MAGPAIPPSGRAVGARVVGPKEVAGTVGSEKPWELGGGKGTNRQISMRGFEDCKWLPKTLKPSPSVADSRCEGAPIFANLKAPTAPVWGRFHTKLWVCEIRKLLGFGPFHFDPWGQKLSVCTFA